ncbi:MAG: hypothetical protein N4A33_05135 [Bacteriovoracaceae bacterium]|jgi:3-methyladenine DNA glycosylase AlkC|nr:hypothetical protein [Bacteriovoracaceae bacterium]
MKQRVELISDSINEFFDLSYKKIITHLIKKLDEVKNMNSFWIWPLTDYVHKFGLNDLKTSMKAQYEMTKRFSAEFSIRYFLQKYEKEIFDEFLFNWTHDPCEHIRRLASEGTRPNLPWGIKVHYLNKNLKQNIKLLNKLKNDDSLYVRKSVANHLNDISRVDEKLFIKTLLAWKNPNEKQRWIIKHASRSLLKNANSDVLKLNGYDTNPKVKITRKKLSKDIIKEGDSFDLSFSIKNLDKKDLNLSIDYIIYYPKKNGSLSPKVFKLKDIILKENESKALVKKIKFKKVTTRVHYKGIHKIELKISDIHEKFSSFTLK